LINLIRSFTPLGRWVIGGLLAAVVVAGILLLQTCQEAREADTKAELASNQTEAALANGRDAVETSSNVRTRVDAIDMLTKENTDAIRSAEGAGTPVPAAVDAVARERLCRRSAYRQRPECLQYAPAE
jgi:hypothetical protein